MVHLGLIETYVHTGSKLGVMVEVNCETDFVSKGPLFKELAKGLAMQIAACPTVTVVKFADFTPEEIDAERKIELLSDDLAGKPDTIKEKIVEGRVKKIFNTKVLLEQPYIRDPSMTVDDFVKSYIAKIGENIQVKRFVKFNLGGDDPKEEDDEAAEAA